MQSGKTSGFAAATGPRHLVTTGRLAGALSLAALLLVAAPVEAQQSRATVRQAAEEFDREALAPDTLFQGPDRLPIHGVRCATRPISRLEARMVRARLKAWRREQSRAGYFAASNAVISIPVAFHVVTDGSAGDISDSQINQQINVLSAAFSGAGFSFHLASTDRTDNSSWFRGCAGGQEMPMKNALASDPATTLNIYTCEPRGGILGYAYLPQDLGESSATHGVVLLYSSLPGGSAVPYDLGDTGTHEVGHYLGLYAHVRRWLRQPRGRGG